jgi:protein-tyrosine phosphatase
MEEARGAKEREPGDAAGRRAVGRTVLFLCTGNYYRSRFAEVLFNLQAERLGLSWRATSRGLALELLDATDMLSVHAIKRLTALGIPTDGHLRRPQQVSEDDLREAALVIALKEAEHRPLLTRKHPEWADRVEYWHVHDLDGAAPQQALPLIERLVLSLASRLASEE